MNDREIIEATARLWITLGGDREGFEWCQSQIAEAIEKIQNTITKNKEMPERER